MSLLVRRIREKGYEWSPPPEDHPDHPLRSAKRLGDAIHVSGQVPVRNGEIVKGKVGDGGLSVEEAAKAAELCALNCLLAAGSIVPSERIWGVVSMTVYVNVAPGFTQMSLVANGASGFLIDVLDEDGKSARAAIGVASLPENAAVEVTMIIEVR